jgi:NAD(P)-dependent dehydrogenase (short-subunit alcohol dehydrogenase family)
MAGRFQDRVVVVTGAASGIGAASVRRFHSEGASVVIADVQEDAAETLAAELGERALFVHCDVSDEAAVSTLVDRTIETFGRLDVFYANAGVMGALGPISKLPREHVETTVAINLLGVIWSVKHAARVMVPQGSGVILATSSPAGLVGGVGPHVYSATKAGILGLVQSVAAELRPHGIRVNAIVPGSILSAMTADIMTGNAADLEAAAEALAPSNLIDRPGAPEDIAGAAAYLASDDARFVTGSTFNIDAGYTYAPGTSPFAQGDYAEPIAMFEAGRHG